MISAVIMATLIQTHAQSERGERGRDFSPEKHAERMTERMTEKLDLNEEQQKEIHALHLEQAQKRKTEMEARREAMKVEREAREAKIAGILSPEQKEKWETMREENRQNIKEGRKGPGKRMMNRGARRANRPG